MGARTVHKYIAGWGIGRAADNKPEDNMYGVAPLHPYGHLDPTTPFMDSQLLTHHTYFVRFNEGLEEEARRWDKGHLHLRALALERVSGNARDPQAEQFNVARQVMRRGKLDNATAT